MRLAGLGWFWVVPCFSNYAEKTHDTKCNDRFVRSAVQYGKCFSFHYTKG